MGVIFVLVKRDKNHDPAKQDQFYSGIRLFVRPIPKGVVVFHAVSIRSVTAAS